MATIKAEANGVYGVEMHIAVPKDTNLAVKIYGHQSPSAWFSGNFGREPVLRDTQRALIECNGQLNFLELSLAKEYVLDERRYELSGIDVDAFSQLIIRAKGRKRDCVDSLVIHASSMFSDYLNLRMNPLVSWQQEQGFENILSRCDWQLTLCDRYSRLKQALIDPTNLPNLPVRYGLSPNIVCNMMAELQGNSDPEALGKIYATSINRVVGKIPGIDDPVELSMLYIEGSSVEPMLFGTFLSVKRDHCCPLYEHIVCDASKAAAGYAFGDNKIIAACSVVTPFLAITRPNLGRNIVPMYGRSNCSTAVVIQELTDPFDGLSESFTALRIAAPSVREQSKLAEGLARIIYDNK